MTIRKHAGSIEWLP